MSRSQFSYFWFPTEPELLRVVISRVISRVTILITHIRGLITPFIP